MRDRLGVGLRKPMMNGGDLHSAQDLRECAVQPAQLALEGSIVLVFVVFFGRGGRMCVGVPCGVPERAPLCEQQEEDAEAVRESTLRQASAQQ